jgi:two-component system, OmpR family, copper resistance phosphate regulon response regulator CusR
MNGKRILLAEDEQKIAQALKQGLEERGYEVTAAYDGNIALKLFGAEKWDLVILDINLPGLNGFEVCKSIRAADPQVPVIMLTALNGMDNKVEGYDAGADDYLVKPFAFQELVLKIHVLLRRTSEQPFQKSNMLQIADLEMNLDTKSVKRGGTEIVLTAKEFQLLEYLMRNRSRVVSRADIAINVWDIDFDTNTNVIDVYINYLRNKVDKPFEQKLIHTQVGMGYILKEPK